MLLTISTTYQPATDLGFLLHKHPEKVQTFALNFGKAHVFYPEATPEKCTAALLLDINTIELMRDKDRENFPLRQYVNDRPYVASSFLSVAIAEVYRSALSGKCASHAELVEQAIPLTATLSVVPCRGGETLLRELFEPLGYAVTLQNYHLDEQFPQWGQSNYFTLTLENTLPLQTLLAHLYVLIPVLDNDKHYYVDHHEIEKLLRHGEGWLATHPRKDLIARRYLKHRHDLHQEALRRLLVEDGSEIEAEEADEDMGEMPLRLHDERLGAVVSVLKASGAQRILDLGCGTGSLIRLLLKEKQFTAVKGMDVSHLSLERAVEYLHLDRMPRLQRERLELVQGSIIYRDERLFGYEAAAVVEVIEHLDLSRLQAFERNLFEFIQARLVVITTPNADYNVKWASLPAGEFRHKDHRFEWTRAEFQNWAQTIAEHYGYGVRFLPIGPLDEALGAPSQMAIFERELA